MLKALIAAAILLPATPAIASDCITNASGNRVCIHRVKASGSDPNINLVEMSMNSGKTVPVLVDCSDYTAYNPIKRTLEIFAPSSAFHRVCTEWE